MAKVHSSLAHLDARTLKDPALRTLGASARWSHPPEGTADLYRRRRAITLIGHGYRTRALNQHLPSVLGLIREVGRSPLSDKGTDNSDPL